MSKSARLVFFGTEDFSLASLKALLEAGYPVVAMVTKPKSRAGRGQKLSQPAVKHLAEENDILVFQPEKLSEIVPELQSLKPSHGILVSYGKIIPKSVLELFPGGIINVHPSLLPAWRGPSPIESAILAGDKQTGVSLMRLSEGMDEGPVYAQITHSLSGGETRLELYEKLSTLGAKFLIEKLPAILDGSQKPKPQDSSKATYSKLLKKNDGLIDFDEPADVIERKVRAFLGYPKTRAKIFDHEVIIAKSQVAASQADGQLVLKANPGWLEVLELIAPSGRVVSGAEYIRGYGPA